MVGHKKFHSWFMVSIAAMVALTAPTMAATTISFEGRIDACCGGGINDLSAWGLGDATTSSFSGRIVYDETADIEFISGGTHPHYYYDFRELTIQVGDVVISYTGAGNTTRPWDASLVVVSGAWERLQIVAHNNPVDLGEHIISGVSIMSENYDDSYVLNSDLNQFTKFADERMTFTMGTISTMENKDYYLQNVRATSVVSGVPEPSTWSMMILGFGMAGMAVRRRKRIVYE